MQARIAEMKTVREATKEAFDERVNYYLKLGWMPYGDVDWCCNSDGQATEFVAFMVRYA